jgi:hypothetical protein
MHFLPDLSALTLNTDADAPDGDEYGQGWRQRKRTLSPTPKSRPTVRRLPGSSNRDTTMKMTRVVELLDAVKKWLGNGNITNEMMNNAVAEIRELVFQMFDRNWVFDVLLRSEDAIDVVRDAVERLWRLWRFSTFKKNNPLMSVEYLKGLQFVINDLNIDLDSDKSLRKQLTTVLAMLPTRQSSKRARQNVDSERDAMNQARRQAKRDQQNYLKRQKEGRLPLPSDTTESDDSGDDSGAGPSSMAPRAAPQKLLKRLGGVEVSPPSPPSLSSESQQNEDDQPGDDSGSGEESIPDFTNSQLARQQAADQRPDEDSGSGEESMPVFVQPQSSPRSVSPTPSTRNLGSNSREYLDAGETEIDFPEGETEEDRMLEEGETEEDEILEEGYTENDEEYSGESALGR